MRNLTIDLEILLANRIKLSKIMDDLSKDELFYIPKGFSNNILWHIGHCVASQQRLIYLRSGLPTNISDEYHNNFKIGTSPNNWVQTPDLTEIKTSLLRTVEILKVDLEMEVFQNYEPLQSSMGFMIKNHLDAISYTNFHEAEHTGSLQYLIKIIDTLV